MGDLRYRRLIDEITDADRSIIYTEEVTATVVRTGSISDRLGRVVWRCNGGDIEVFLRANDLPADSSLIRWRVDNERASQEEFWRPGTSGMSIFAPDESAGLLTLQAKGGERLVVRLMSPDGVSYDYSFSLLGSHEAIERLGCDPARRRGVPTAAGTSHQVRGSYKADPLFEEQWVHATSDSPPSGAR
jgi:hypothetical protein